MAWQWGPVTLRAGESQRWWFKWGPGDPGQEIIGVHPISTGNQIQYTSPGVQLNEDCSLTYLITVSNVGTSIVEFYFRGTSI
jgi:hypothetical protein